MKPVLLYEHTKSMKNKFPHFIFLILLLFASSCAKDDSISPVEIETNSDLITINQNSQTEVFIFQNDFNIPNQGQLSITAASKGIAIIKDNGTNTVLSDDYIEYTPTPNIIGQDTFQYTICDSASPANCKTETITINISSLSVVNYESENIPYQNLSDYNFFQGELKNLNPTFGVTPYELISPLFSDYAHKKRFIWMPNGEKATYESDYSTLNFPTGTMIIKNFFYENVLPQNQTRLLETRIMYKKAEGWDFAEYVWNEEQTEATLDNEGSFVNLSWMEGTQTQSVNYRIPSRSECFTCHNKFGTPLPIGPKPQNLNKTFSYTDGDSNQLNKLIQIGYLDSDLPLNIDTTVAWDDESQSLDLRVRSYLDINCAHCHSDESYCEYRSMRFAYEENNTDENIGVCVTPDTQFIPNSKIVMPSDKELSILHYRMNTSEEQIRMPLFGRTLIHEEGVRLIEEWINSLTDNCN